MKEKADVGQTGLIRRVLERDHLAPTTIPAPPADSPRRRATSSPIAATSAAGG